MSGTTEDAALRPFRVSIPDEELVELRRRVQATRWPERETVADGSQGVQLATMQELVRYWGTEYDFRRFEARLNAVPQFITEIGGLDIHLAARHPLQHARHRSARRFEGTHLERARDWRPGRVRSVSRRATRLRPA
jgi:Epoxide hydrolase N terminus